MLVSFFLGLVCYLFLPSKTSTKESVFFIFLCIILTPFLGIPLWLAICE